MIRLLDSATGSYRIECPTCGKESTVIENQPNKDSAAQEAIADGWSRVASNQLQCPQCSNSEVERFVKVNSP